MNDTILQVQNLSVAFRKGNKADRAVNNVSFSIHNGEMLALVGESGSGKSVTSLAIMGLLPEATAVIEGGKAIFDNKDLLQLPKDKLNSIRGKSISMIFQEPMTALNPVLSIGWQLTEVLKLHEGMNSQQANSKAIELLEQVGIPAPEKRMKDYPHNLSGGMKQRVMIAMALACKPRLLIADEPTTALDVTVQAQIMDLLGKLRKEYGTAILLITHNLALVREQADKVAVMYAGNIVEQASCTDLFEHPTHPYTRLLLQSIPSTSRRGSSLMSIAGHVPSPADILPGCRFAPRCPYYSASECDAAQPELKEIDNAHSCACFKIKAQDTKQYVPSSSLNTVQENPSAQSLLDISHLKVLFPVRSSIFSRQKSYVHAVEDVSFSLNKGETLAIVGESGCGKTTIGKTLIRLFKQTAGSIVMNGTDICTLPQSKLKAYRKQIQMIFQDPFGSLDPRLMVGESIAEGMDAHGMPTQNREKTLLALLEKVGLPSDSLSKYPHQFSGGQRQRIGIARALAVQPDIIVCDECTSALDVSVQAQILNLLKILQSDMGLSYILITHDLSVVGYIADRVIVMYLGRIMEEGTAEEVLEHPMHPYTQALIASAPRLDRTASNEQIRIQGEVPSPINPPTGCPFHTRCPNSTEKCTCEIPNFTEISVTHKVACLNLLHK